MRETKGYAAHTENTPLSPFIFKRRDVGPTDVAIDILYCGICHSDLHQVKNEWGFGQYPMVPGHEIVGKISAIGSEVTKFQVGQPVGVGCLVDSCRQCDYCHQGQQQFCAQGSTHTYNGMDKHLGGVTYGGYSEHVVVEQDFVVTIPDTLPLAESAPLLCAGITTYSPLKRAGVKEGMRVGIVGMGGLGHVAIKLALAMGAQVVALTRSSAKAEEARRLGAHEVIISSKYEQMDAAQNSFDFILDTVSAKHDINAYFNLLKREGTLTQVGLPGEPLSINVFPLVVKRLNFNGSLIGGLPETQEMLDFCGKHNITAEIELINIQEINQAYERLERADVKYRFVIDMASLK